MSLSKNVMNMKFMQTSLKRQEVKEETRKIKDDSEWTLPNHALIRQSLKPTVLVKSVGYGSIAMAKQEDDKQEKMESNENRFTVDSDAQKFLRSIEKGKRKRKKEYDGVEVNKTEKVRHKKKKIAKSE